MAGNSREQKKTKVVEVLNKARAMELFEAIIDEEQIHFNYFDNVNSHIEQLGPVYLAQIAGTPSATGPASQGFVARQGQ
jgi:bacterioferritin